MKVQETNGASLPGAWIVNPKDKGRKSIKSGNIYLDNEEEFQIELHNPLKECVLADIRLNGQSISKSGLVLKPGQRVYLDCFIDDKKKFIFQTYEVENTQESKDAIGNNGLMEVFFYKEEAVSLNNWSEKLRQTVVREYYPIYVDRYPYWYPYYRPYPWYGGCTTTTIYNGCFGSNTGTNLSFSAGTTSTGSTLSSGSISTNALYNNLTSFSGDISFDCNTGNLSLTSGTIPCCNNIETGRIEKGETSNQKFTEVDMDFEKNYIHHIVYNLLPTSRKPIEVESSKKSNDKVSGELLNKTQKLLIGHQAVDLIIKLKDLLEQNLITKEEFDEKKKELLERI